MGSKSGELNRPMRLQKALARREKQRPGTARKTRLVCICPECYSAVMTVPFLEECLSVVTRTPAMLDLFLRDLPEVLTEATEGPGTWIPCVVIRHLIFTEKTDWMPRMTMILEHGVNRTFEPFDHEEQFREGGGKSLAELLDEFRDLRDDSVTRLRSMNLTPERLESEGMHPALGLVTARQLLATWASHDLSHIMQISRVMAKRYKPEVGPWLAYQTVMK